MQSQLIHSEPKWSQRCRLNGLQLGEFCWTRCQLTPTFTYRFRHWGKKKENKPLKKGLGEHLSSSFLNLSSSPAPLLPTLLVSLYLSFALHCTQPLDIAMGGMGCLGSFSTCLSSKPSSTTPFVSLLLCPSTGHPQVAVPQQYLLPCAHPPPCPHNVPFCMSPLPLSQTYLHRGATQPPPLLWHTTGPSWCQNSSAPSREVSPGPKGRFSAHPSCPRWGR